MAKDRFHLETFIRRPPVESVRAVYCNLQAEQPLLLMREPDNLANAGAVPVYDLMRRMCGYIASEHSSQVSARLAAGEMLLAKAKGGCQCLYRRVLIWSEGSAEVEEEKKKRKTKSKEKEMVDAIFRYGSLIKVDEDV